MSKQNCGRNYYFLVFSVHLSGYFGVDCFYMNQRGKGVSVDHTLLIFGVNFGMLGGAMPCARACMLVGVFRRTDTGSLGYTTAKSMSMRPGGAFGPLWFVFQAYDEDKLRRLVRAFAALERGGT